MSMRNDSEYNQFQYIGSKINPQNWAADHAEDPKGLVACARECTGGHVTSTEWLVAVTERLADLVDRIYCGHEDPDVPHGLMARKDVLMLLRDKRVEVKCHVEVAPWPKDEGNPCEDNYMIVDVDFEDVERGVKQRSDIKGFYADVDRGQDGGITLILGKGLCDEHRNLNKARQNRAINVLLAEVSTLKSQIKTMERKMSHGCVDMNCEECELT